MSARAPDTLGREEAMPPLELYEPTAELTSRPLLLDRLEQALRLASRQKHMVAVLLVELDNVRTVNRSLGYAAGDELLAQVGRRMREQVRAGDSVAQLGDDEFAILLPDVTAVGYARAASRIVGSLREPFAIDGHELPMSASIGIATSRGGGVEPATVLQNAGIAMQRAKRQGKAYELFNADMHSAAIRRLGAEAELRRAVARSEFTMHFQPIVGLEAGETVAVEALMRWEHPQHGLLEAQNFIDLAEETQLILPLGRFALRESCRRLSAWQAEDARGQSVGLFVNVSAQQLATPRFAHEVLEALRETGLEPGRLTLEMTETLMKPDADCLLAMLRRLRAAGVRIALDDFGTGYSSLAYLSHLPIDVVKLAKEFTDGMGVGRGSAVMGATLALCRALGVEVVAEGIERPEQLAELRELGADMGQGYLLGRAAPGEVLPGSLGLA